MNLEQLRAQLVALRDEIRDLSALTDITPEQETRLTAALEEFPPLEEQLQAAETRAAQIDHIRQSATRWADGIDTPGQINRTSPFEGDIRAITDRGELRSRAMRAVEERGTHLSERQKVGLERLMQARTLDTDGAVIARNLLLTENDAYRSAFMKALSSQSPAFTAEEARAVDEYRVANEGTTAAGGFGVPVLIDPTIILTSGAAAAPLLDISKIITITTNQWKGVSSPGFTWQYQAESAVVTDNTPTLAQPTIPVYASRGFVPYTIEWGQDYPGAMEELQKLLEQGYLNLMAVKTMLGSGSGEPTGIFTRMQNTTTNPAHVICTTLGTLGAVDVRKAWGALPELFRSRATYAMSIAAENQIRAWGNGLALSDYTVNMAADGTSVLTGRPVVLSDYAPAWTGTTGAASALVVGDFQHFVIVQRAGMVVELVPHLFDPTTGFPIGQRGLFAYARAGHDVDTAAAFRLIANS